MGDDPESLILVYLRRLDTKLDQVAENQRDHGRRLTAVEVAVSNFASMVSHLTANNAIRSDVLEARVERIERRVDLKDS